MRVRSKQFICAGALIAIGGGIGVAITARAQQQQQHLGYQDTPMLPSGKWHVHDGTRPQPKVIDPGSFSAQDAPGKPPSDAIILFDGTDLSKWVGANGKPAAWKVENGVMEIDPKAGSIQTKEAIGDCQLHVEWSAPTPPNLNAHGQERGNSGVMFFGGKYEIQVLDSWQNPTYPDGQAAGIYGSYPPLVNATRKPGEWQIYDIIFTVPRFEGDKLVKPGYFTVLHNGVVVHNHAELLGETQHRQFPVYHAHPPEGPLMLQDHGNKVRYRNIWYRKLKNYDEP